VVYVSRDDPLGLNPDHNSEVFLYEPATGSRRQLTVSTGGGSYSPRITRDGSWVYFKSTAPLFEDIPSRPWEAYRVSVASEVIERVGGLRRPPAELGQGSWKYEPYRVVPDGDGDRAVFSAEGEWAEGNADWSSEVWLVDQSVPAAIRVGKESPTLVSWDVEPRPRRYDVIRGDVDNLRSGGPGVVDLGPVVCLENDSPDADTAGFEDPVTPASGQALFFVRRGTQGLGDRAGSYGRGSDGSERIPGAGDCEP
jgi:hypothetical protein